MKMYKDDVEAYVDKDQVPYMRETGWKTKAELSAVPPVDEDSDEETSDEETTEETSDDETSDDEEVVAKKATRKGSRIIKK